MKGQQRASATHTHTCPFSARLPSHPGRHITLSRVPHGVQGGLSHSVVSLCDPMDCNPPGSSFYGLLQARTLERVVMPFSRGSSDQGIYPGLLHCGQSEPPGNLLIKRAYRWLYFLCQELGRERGSDIKSETTLVNKGMPAVSGVCKLSLGVRHHEDRWGGTWL